MYVFQVLHNGVITIGALGIQLLLTLKETWELNSCRFPIPRPFLLHSPPFQDAEVKVGTKYHEPCN